MQKKENFLRKKMSKRKSFLIRWSFDDWHRLCSTLVFDSGLSIYFLKALL